MGQKAGTALGVLAALLILRRLRKRRKEKRLAKARARARARAIELRIKEEKTRGKAGRKAPLKGDAKKKVKKAKRDRSITEQLIRFTVLAVMKKVISQQIDKAGLDLGKSRLGRKVVEASAG